MSAFTAKEIEYLTTQRLARLATIRPDGTPQIAPVGFHYNPELDVIEIGGRFLSKSKKFRNILQNSNVALVIDDVLPPWQPRGIEIRGTAQTLPTGGQALFGANYQADDALIRVTPARIIGWGLDPDSGWAKNRKVERN